MIKFIFLFLIASLALADYVAPPLPSNAAKETGGNLDSINTKLTSPITVQQASALSISLPGSMTVTQSSVITINLPSNAATGTKQDTGNTSLSSIDAKLTAPLYMWFASTGHATSALQSTGNSSLSSIDTKQSTGNASLSSIDSKLTAPLYVWFASAGHATSALQTTGNNSLSSIDTKLTAPLYVWQASQISVKQASVISVAASGSFPITTAGDLSVKMASTNYVWQASVITVAANAGTNLNTSLLALDSSVNGILRTQGSTTSAQTGPLVQGAVTTSPPSYTTAQTSPLSLTLQGLLRVDGSSVTQTVSMASQAYINFASQPYVNLASSLPAGTNRIGSARLVDSADADLTSGKSTQTARFVGVQEAKDGGRIFVAFSTTTAAAGSPGIETAITLTKNFGFTPNSNATSFTCTNGKTFRITQMTFGQKGHLTATAAQSFFSFRVNASGAVTTGSLPIVLTTRTATIATASSYDRVTLPFADGFELPCNGTMQFGVTANSQYLTNAPTWDVQITGFEY